MPYELPALSLAQNINSKSFLYLPYKLTLVIQQLNWCLLSVSKEFIMAQAKYNKSKVILKIQLTQVGTLLESNAIDIENLQLRLQRLTEKHETFEKLIEDIISTDEQAEITNEFLEVQDRFLNIAARIKRLIEQENTRLSSNSMLSSAENSGKRVKLPIATLPKFYGNYEQWLSFKNGFKSMIDKRDDLTNLEKLIYLRSSLVDKAAQKISIFDDSEENYKRAWELLQESYEIKRLIVSKHLEVICNLPKLSQETHDGLIGLSDSVHQHVSALNSLGASVGTDMLVHIIENRLPEETAKKWELTLKNDQLPTFEQLRKFLSETADQPQNKKPKPNKKQHIFHMNAAGGCVICKGHHSRYQCQDFLKMPVTERFEAVRKSGFCINCLRKNPGRCIRSKCKECHKNHNTLLHFKRQQTTHTTVVNETSEKQA
ncbi:uncharacterized protein [Prorops nasuta]|uniref:uncharacterized protein n=1 Tax=Prorops nasuta TaxID=863751 RepID=UPI0034CFCE09